MYGVYLNGFAEGDGDAGGAMAPVHEAVAAPVLHTHPVVASEVAVAYHVAQRVLDVCVLRLLQREMQQHLIE